MTFYELMAWLGSNGLTPTENQVRWVIQSGKVPKPEMAGYRFRFSEEDAVRIAEVLMTVRKWRASRVA